MNKHWQELLSKTRLRESQADKNRDSISKADNRNAFESDFGRVIFSSACRRLHDKTQVFPLTSDDNIHSRLTHSLEVMNIGLSFAIYLCDNEEFKRKTELDNDAILRQISPILKTSCLVHDIGNPPFGHFGEEVIQCYFTKLLSDLRKLVDSNSDICGVHELSRFIFNNISHRNSCNGTSQTDFHLSELKDFLNNEDLKYDYTQFDGNAQGFRVLTKLQYIGDLFGLNLTYATLASTLKYPNWHGADKGADDIAVHKHGVFYTEKKYANDIMQGCALNCNDRFHRHPLSFLMEAADSICYSIMDLEDAIKKQWIDLEELKAKINNSDISKEIKDKISDTIKTTNSSNQNRQKELVSLRTALLSHLMEVATNNFVKNLEEIVNGTYNKELIEDNDGLFGVLKKIAIDKVYSNKEITSLEMTGDAVISGIFDFYFYYLFHENKAFRDRGKTLISRSIMMAVIDEHKQNYNDSDLFKKKYGSYNNIEGLYEEFDVADFTVEERFRLIRDFVACMTDKFALNHFRMLNGSRI